MSKRRKGRPLQRVGKAADNANALITEVRQFGVDVSLVSIKPPTVRVEIGDRQTTDDDSEGGATLLKQLAYFFKGLGS